mmetsp:Transcript_51183/g.153048  ORF Transcript_51183/g.153048 Transcript_51183/m.153048 type:complete len:234 (-) Transcript_51183:98-799(-)
MPAHRGVQRGRLGGHRLHPGRPVGVPLRALHLQRGLRLPRVQGACNLPGQDLHPPDRRGPHARGHPAAGGLPEALRVHGDRVLADVPHEAVDGVRAREHARAAPRREVDRPPDRFASHLVPGGAGRIRFGEPLLVVVLPGLWGGLPAVRPEVAGLPPDSPDGLPPAGPRQTHGGGAPGHPAEGGRLQDPERHVLRGGRPGTRRGQRRRLHEVHGLRGQGGGGGRCRGGAGVLQ